MFGADFMSEKRAAARARRRADARVQAGNRAEAEGRVEAEARARSEVEDRTQAETHAHATAEAQARAEARAHAQDIFGGLRELGFRAAEARRAAEFSETLEGATLEQRMRAALQFLRPKRNPRAEGSENRRDAPGEGIAANA